MLSIRPAGGVQTKSGESERPPAGQNVQFDEVRLNNNVQLWLEQMKVSSHMPVHVLQM